MSDGLRIIDGRPAVHVDDLRGLRACHNHVDRFRVEFGSYAHIPLDTLRRAFEVQIDVNWWALEVFGKAYQEAIAPADKAYQEAIAPAYKAYQEAIAPAYKAYQEAIAPAIVDLAERWAKSALQAQAAAHA